MAEGEKIFRYVAIEPSGKRVTGSLPAAAEEVVFNRLKRDGLSPVKISPARRLFSPAVEGRPLTDRESADFLADAAALLKAGSDLRTVLGALGSRSDRPAVSRLCRVLNAEISGGGAVDRSFARALPKRHAFVAALIAAGEASGDIAGGLQRAADLLASRLRLRDQLVSALSYPIFVLASTIAAILVILFFLVPSLAPLAEMSGGPPPLVLHVLMVASEGLRGNLLTFGAIFAIGALLILIAAGTGALAPWLDRLMLDGPARRITGGLVYGAFAISLGDMLAAGAPMSESLRLAVKATVSPLGRSRLDVVTAAVRQGESLSAALDKVRGFPPTIARLAHIGEASGALGRTLARAGRFEEDAALRRIETLGKMLGPVMIVLLGGLIGLLMGGLLTGVQELGNAALT